MLKKLRTQFFRDERQFQLFSLLLASSFLGAALVVVRLLINRNNWHSPDSLGDLLFQRGPMYIFLLWNLALAWVPYLAALSIHSIERRKSSRWLPVGLVLLVWLAFFPNAPYIVTDLLHLRPKPPVPHWFDLILLLSFACTGLMLGLLSLYEVQIFLKKRLSEGLVWAITVGSVFLAGFGVWLGRYLRWNSWDILTQPLAMAKDVGRTLLQPTAFAKMISVSLLLAGFLLVGYFMLLTLLNERKKV